MRYLGEASFWLTLVAVGLAFYLNARRGIGPGRLLGESWSLMLLVALVVAASMGVGWLVVRIAQRRDRKERPAGRDEEAGPR